MAQSVFQGILQPRRSVLQRVFRQYPHASPIIAVNNLLAQKPVMQLSLQDLDRINERYGVIVQMEFDLNLQEFYATYLNHRLATEKDRIDQSDFHELNHLASVLKIAASQQRKLNGLIGQPYYESIMSQAFTGATVDNHALDKARELAAFLEISETTTKSVHDTLMREYLMGLLQPHLKRKRFSPDDEAAFNNITARLNVTPAFSDEITSALNRCKMLWALENSSPEKYDAPTLLQRGEECFFISNKVEWYEFRSHRGTQMLTHLETGPMYATNQRIIFASTGKTINLKFSAIVDFIMDGEYLQIRKESGKDPYLKMPELDEFEIIFSKLLRQFQSGQQD